MSITEVPFSQLLQHSRDTLEKLEENRGRLRLVRRDREVLNRVFPAAFPWMRYLPYDEAPAFITEFIDTAHACVGLDTLMPLSAVVAAWRATASVYADEDLLKTLTVPHDEADYGEVPEPDTR